MNEGEGEEVSEAVMLPEPLLLSVGEREAVVQCVTDALLLEEGVGRVEREAEGQAVVLSVADREGVEVAEAEAQAVMETLLLEECVLLLHWVTLPLLQCVGVKVAQGELETQLLIEPEEVWEAVIETEEQLVEDTLPNDDGEDEWQTEEVKESELVPEAQKLAEEL